MSKNINKIIEKIEKIKNKLYHDEDYYEELSDYINSLNLNNSQILNLIKRFRGDYEILGIISWLDKKFSKEVIEALWKNINNVEIKRGLVGNKGLSDKEKILDILENDKEDLDILEELFRNNENIPVDFLYKFAKSKKESLRALVAECPSLPKDLIYKLSEDENYGIVLLIAERSDLPEDLLYKLSEDTQEGVRYVISERSDLSKDLIIKLSCDVAKAVKNSAFEKIKKLNSLKKEELEKGYDLIRESKYIGRDHFEVTFDFIIDEFPELTELAKMFKRIILKGKNDLK